MAPVFRRHRLNPNPSRPGSNAGVGTGVGTGMVPGVVPGMGTDVSGGVQAVETLLLFNVTAPLWARARPH